MNRPQASSGCQFKLTRGVRQDQACGRPVYRSADRQLCLQHIRMISNNPKYATHDVPFTSLQINKPIEQPRTIIEPAPDVVDDIIAYSSTFTPPDVEPTEEEETEILLKMLNEFKKEIKVGRNK